MKRIETVPPLRSAMGAVLGGVMLISCGDSYAYDQHRPAKVTGKEFIPAYSYEEDGMCLLKQKIGEVSICLARATNTVHVPDKWFVDLAQCEDEYFIAAEGVSCVQPRVEVPQTIHDSVLQGSLLKQTDDNWTIISQ